MPRHNEAAAAWSLKVRFLGGLAVSLALLGIAEATLRLAGFSYQPPAVPLVLRTPKVDRRMSKGISEFRPSKTCLWENIPGAQDSADGGTINEQGYRGEPLPPSRGPEHLRIVCLGDSSTYGAHVASSETFSSQLETLLRERGLDADVLNAGVIGFSSLQTRVHLENRILPMRPDVVVLYLGALNDGTPRGVGSPLTDREKLERIASRDTSLARTLQMLLKLRLVQLVRRVVAPAPDWTQQMTDLDYSSVNDVSAATGEYTKRVPLEEFRENIVSCVRQARQTNVTPILVVPTRREEVEQDIPYYIRYTETLIETARALDVPYLDIHGLVRASPGGTDAHHVEGSRVHPNPEGHRLIASELADCIVNELDLR